MMGLLDLVGGPMRRVAATSGGEYSGPCPWCGGTDRFRVWPEHPSGQARWWCRQCGRHGDAIDMLRERDGLSYAQAAGAVGQKIPVRATRPSLRRRVPPSLCPPNALWQAHAEQLAQDAENALWEPRGARALSYLRGRGFADETIRGARLGYVNEGRREPAEVWGLPEDRDPIWTPCGIALPWRACGAGWRFNIRRPVGKPKYIGPAGWVSSLYGADGLHSRRSCVLVEGEFDALAVAQEAGDLVAAVATGSTSGARHPKWLGRLAAANLVLVAFDRDEAGEAAAGWWQDALPRARRLVPEGDPAGMLEAGVDVREWVLDALAESLQERNHHQ